MTKDPNYQGTFVIALENGHERKKIIYASYNGLERGNNICL